VDLFFAMFDMQQQDDSGVSPVIGVILMVAVTVALVALVTVVVFDLGGDVSDSPDATVQLEESDQNVTATLLRNENVEGLYLSYTDANGNSVEAGNDDGSDMQNAGDTIDTSETGDYAAGEKEIQAGSTVNVIAVMPDGSEEVLTSTDIEA
jgi:flagellin-like protein